MSNEDQDPHSQGRPSEEFICGECGAEFDAEKEFQQHVKREHGTEM